MTTRVHDHVTHFGFLSDIQDLENKNSSLEVSFKYPRLQVPAL